MSETLIPQRVAVRRSDQTFIADYKSTKMAQPPTMDAQPAYPSGFEGSSSSGEASLPFNSKVEGYDYEFVPPAENHYECTICQLVLREPRQTPCGHRFCRDCIMKWISVSSPARCPVDNTPITKDNLFPDNFAKREIQNLKVRCPNNKREEGKCEVIETVKDMPTHLNECPFAVIMCPNRCVKLIIRRDLEDHVTNQCEKRLVSCPDCRQQGQAIDFQNHAQTCPQGKLHCEQCQEDVVRQEMEKHCNDVCPGAHVFCMFSPFGCDTQIERSQLDTHVRECLVPHLSMLCDGMVAIMKAVGMSRVPSQGSAPFSRDLTPTEISSVMSSLVQPMQQLSLDVRHPHMESLPQFSVHPSTTISRSLDSTSAAQFSLSPSSHSMHRSSSDPKYSFYVNSPSVGTMEASGFSHTSAPSDYSGLKMGAASSLASYVTGLESESSKHQDERLVLHQQSLLELQAKTETLERTLKQKIKLYDQQISELEGRMCNGQYYWRIRNYSRFQREAEHGETTALHSHPFYTSPCGYKLCIRANLYGVDSARGSHLSLFIHFMQGEYDDVLEWPFTGRIVLSVVDQNECWELRNHVAETLSAKPNLAAFQRPTTPRNHKGFGYMEFLPLSVLRNSTYIRNDTLIIKAHVLPNG